eukprot:8335607-Alexandrium_andersonii.AAC.1
MCIRDSLTAQHAAAHASHRSPGLGYANVRHSVHVLRSVVAAGVSGGGPSAEEPEPVGPCGEPAGSMASGPVKSACST